MKALRTVNGQQRQVCEEANILDRLWHRKYTLYSALINLCCAYAYLHFRTFHRLYLSFILDDEALKEKLDQFLQEVKKSEWFLMFFDSITTFIVGLCSFRFFRETRMPLWKERGRKSLASMKRWATQGTDWNFKQKVCLLAAEEYYSDGQFVSLISSELMHPLILRSYPTP